MWSVAFISVSKHPVGTIFACKYFKTEAVKSFKCLFLLLWDSWTHAVLQWLSVSLSLFLIRGVFKTETDGLLLLLLQQESSHEGHHTTGPTEGQKKKKAQRSIHISCCSSAEHGLVDIMKPWGLQSCSVCVYEIEESLSKMPLYEEQCRWILEHEWFLGFLHLIRLKWHRNEDRQLYPAHDGLISSK